MILSKSLPYRHLIAKDQNDASWHEALSLTYADGYLLSALPFLGVSLALLYLVF